ncbi:MAG TPA: hypothetical protein GX730_01475, partial [Chloroflexi bacterium]|nr:hypothetical protein [Chloroflexota bacterium]
MSYSKRFTIDFNQDMNGDYDSRISTLFLTKNRTSAKEPSFTAPLIMLFNEPLLPMAATRLYDESDVSDPALMREAIENRKTLIGCYPL